MYLFEYKVCPRLYNAYAFSSKDVQHNTKRSILCTYLCCEKRMALSGLYSFISFLQGGSYYNTSNLTFDPNTDFKPQWALKSSKNNICMCTTLYSPSCIIPFLYLFGIPKAF